MDSPLGKRLQQLALALRGVMLGGREHRVSGSHGLIERRHAVSRQGAHHHQARGAVLILADEAFLVAERPDPPAGAGPLRGDRGRRSDGGQLRTQAGEPRLYGSQVLFGK